MITLTKNQIFTTGEGDEKTTFECIDENNCVTIIFSLYQKAKDSYIRQKLFEDPSYTSHNHIEENWYTQRGFKVLKGVK